MYATGPRMDFPHWQAVPTVSELGQIATSRSVAIITFATLASPCDTLDNIPGMPQLPEVQLILRVGWVGRH
jgi:hypothetical protein